jgi:hypothetical protein
VGALLSQRSQSQQLMLDSFFASLAGPAGLERVASDRAFAQARNKLRPAALTALNAFHYTHLFSFLKSMT